MKTIDELWEKYRDAIYPDGIGEIQTKECKQAFVAGALSAHVRIAKMSTKPFKEAHDEFKAFEAELLEYAKVKEVESNERN